MAGGRAAPSLRLGCTLVRGGGDFGGVVHCRDGQVAGVGRSMGRLWSWSWLCSCSRGCARRGAGGVAGIYSQQCVFLANKWLATFDKKNKQTNFPPEWGPFFLPQLQVPIRVRRRVAPRGKSEEDRARLTSRCASSGCQLRCSGTTLPTGAGSRGFRHGGLQPQFSTPAYGGHKSSAEVGPNAEVGSNAEAGSNAEVGSNTPGKARCQGSNTIWNVQCQPATRPRLANRQG